jgi:predicted HTH domain antitoxin
MVKGLMTRGMNHQLHLGLPPARISDVTRRTATLLDRELQATVRSGIFRTKAEGVQEALGALFTSKPQYRIEAAVEMLRSGEISLGRAAEIAGMNYFAFRELWRQRGGRQGVEVDAADADAQARRLARHRR